MSIIWLIFIGIWWRTKKAKPEVRRPPATHSLDPNKSLNTPRLSNGGRT